MKKATVLVLLFVFAFGFGFGSVQKVTADDCDMSNKQYIDWGAWGCQYNPCKRMALVCGTDFTTGLPCGCAWKCVLVEGCDPANPPIP